MMFFSVAPSRCVFIIALCVGFARARSEGAVAPGPDAFGYTVAETSAYSFTNITNGATKVLNFDDDTSITVNLGFTFNFYGSNYTTVSFNPNGIMTFGGKGTDFANVDLTTTSPSNNLPAIAVLWDDWETQSPGGDAVYYKTVGAPGSRQFIVQWNKVEPIFDIDTLTFEARLFEGNNAILFSYLDVEVSDNPSYGNGAFATVGIRDINGQTNNRNLQWSFNEAVITNEENILFSRPNHPPIALDDTATTGENSPLIINVLANDSDPDGNAVSVANVTPPSHGTATINSNNTVTYTPSVNYNGTDSFSYTIRDGQGGTATATVTVRVWEVRIDSIVTVAPDRVRIHFHGVPQAEHIVLGSSDLLTWTAVGEGTEEEPGIFTFEEPIRDVPIWFYEVEQR